MIVVRRRDVEPGGRYAGGRFAPVVTSAIPDPGPEIFPRALRESTYQRIQDAGYLRARRRTDLEPARARATAEMLDTLAGELQPALAGFATGEREAASASPESDVAGLADLLSALDLNSTSETDPRPVFGESFGGGRDRESAIRIAGGRGEAVRRLLEGLLKSREKPKPPKLPAPKRPDPDRPAPIAPPRPDRPVDRMPDLGGDQRPDGVKPDGPEAEPEIILPDISVVPDPDNMPLKDEFEHMPETGLADPDRIRTVQDTADNHFKTEEGVSGRRPVAELVQNLLSGQITPEELAPIRLFEFDGKIWTLDHRRLVAARVARKSIHYRKATPDEIRTGLKRKRTTKTDGLSIEMKGTED